VSVLLNITPDHLDRYQYNLDLYAAAKFRIAENQTPADVFIYCQDDPGIMSRLGAYPVLAQRQGFALAAGPDTRAWLEDGMIVADGEALLPFGETQLMGRHNQLNTLSAVLAARACGVPAEAIREGLRTFRPIEHRLEPVTTAGGVLYINDSKATNVDSVFFALEGMTRPVIWLAGGVDKGNDYTVLQPLVRDKVKAIVTLGPDTDKFYRDFDKPVTPTMHMTEAVAAAVRLATPGDVVLLSPACASFDLFRNYEDRGRQFKDAVMKTVQHIHP
jgi:UDP-N-acetylmuramoylalanine--D-glutamate ligase